MARTINGRLTGRAAATELAEQRSALFDAAIDKAKEERRQKNEEECSQALAELAEIDPNGWEAWYDDDNNVPAYGLVSERAMLIRTRIAELTEQADYCQTYISGGEVLEISTVSNPNQNIPF